MSILAEDPVVSVLARDVSKDKASTSIELEARSDDEILEFEPLSDDEVHIVISGGPSIGGHVVKQAK